MVLKSITIHTDEGDYPIDAALAPDTVLAVVKGKADESKVEWTEYELNGRDDLILVSFNSGSNTIVSNRIKELIEDYLNEDN